ncbi:M23 family metallopeptidase [Arcticibacterium luteifluviistationis]|uniref:Peptidase M23 n=1 Tax=Arcticibacterium luteifluviistationis TaxID=1784714 RepID=A0A2Z4G7X1_9BACT|nr:M23 family metallopeptidase [Arcticibacterium luteifluviistationis]AWV97246.1 peptidase M23 [Arcticibacterium luteifluviistationis]
MFRSFLVLVLLFSVQASFAQRERGKVIKAPKIFQKKTETTETPSNEPDSQNLNNTFQDEVDFQFEEEPKLRFSNSFEKKTTEYKAPSNYPGSESLGAGMVEIEPLKKLNSNIHEDTSSIDEGELMIVEIEDGARFPGTDEMVKIASYFSIWDNTYVNPYGINPKDFSDVIPIKLYDLTKGRYWAPPLDKCPVTSHFKYRWGRWHRGTDIDLETGDPVYAAFDGVIRISSYRGALGRAVVIRHYNGLETVYGHMSKLNFPVNTVVKAGDEIGRGGNTGRSSGSHLHFETRYEGTPFDAGNIFDFKRDDTQIRMQEFLMTSKMYNYLRGGSPRVALGDVDASQHEDDLNPTMEVEGDAAADDFEDDFEEEIPAEVVQKVWYRVKPGDNLTKIARNFGVTVSEICSLNKISSYKKLYVGIRLRVK